MTTTFPLWGYWKIFGLQGLFAETALLNRRRLELDNYNQCEQVGDILPIGDAVCFRSHLTGS